MLRNIEKLFQFKNFVLRIAIFSDGLWPFNSGGIQKHSYYLAKYLSQKNLKITVFTSSKNFDHSKLSLYFSETELNNIKFVLITSPKIKRFPGNYFLHTYLFSKRIAESINDLEFDILYFQGLCGWIYLINSKSRSKTSKSVLNLHGLNMYQNSNGFKEKIEKFLYRRITNPMLKSSDFVHSLGRNLSEYILSIGIPKYKIFEIGIGIDGSWLLKHVKDNKEVRTFVFIGRYDKVKGFTELNYSLKKLIDIKEKFEFNFIGPIPEGLQVKHKNIYYHGLVIDEREIKLLLDKSDCLVIPSYSEGMPTVILEAMARGCIIIATNVGAVPELVNEENGILIKPFDGNLLFDAMKNVISFSNETLFQMKKNSLNKVSDEYLWDKIIDEMVQQFNEIIESKY